MNKKSKIFLLISLVVTIYIICSFYFIVIINKSQTELTMDNNEVTLTGNSSLKVNQLIDLNFNLIKTESDTKTIESMKSENLSSIEGWKVIETVPSLDTPVCSMQTFELNLLAPQYKNVNFIIISQDLPFAQSRYCGVNNIENISIYSDYQTREFSTKNHLLINETKLNARAILVVNPQNKIVYIEYAKEQTESLNLQDALNSIPKEVVD